MAKTLMEAAWEARECAQVRPTGTKVGCAILGSGGKIYAGWNIEGLWATSIHAEVCAITQLAGSGEKGIEIAIVADTKNFTPCGACLDWLIQFCEPDALVTMGNMENREGHTTLVLQDLYPMYPQR